jgi:hypothetical protein
VKAVPGFENEDIIGFYKLNNLLLIEHTAYDEVNALGELATSKYLQKWEKQEIISPLFS